MKTGWETYIYILFSHFVTTLNNTLEIEFTQEDEGYESGSESLNIPTLFRRVPWIYHISMSENLFFNPTTPLTTAEEHPVHSCWRLRCHSPLCHHLVFSSSDEESPVTICDPHLWHSGTPDSSPANRGAEHPSPAQHHLNHHHTSPQSTNQFFKDDTTKENFPTALLDDDIWSEDHIPDRHLCIHDTSQLNHLCNYPCPYADLSFARNLTPSLTPEAAEFWHDIMDLMDADLEDIMSTTSAEDILDLEDISDYLDSGQLEAWFA